MNDTTTSGNRGAASRIGSHAFTQAAICRGIDPARGASGGWWLLVEPDVQADPGTTLRPDVAAWRRSRLNDVPNSTVDVVPDWICEIMTPGVVGEDRVHKLTQYANAGVAFVWLVHPTERTVEAYQLEGSSWKLLGAWWDGGPVAVPPFTEQEVDLGRLFVPRARPQPNGGARAPERTPEGREAAYRDEGAYGSDAAARGDAYRGDAYRGEGGA